MYESMKRDLPGGLRARRAESPQGAHPTVKAVEGGVEVEPEPQAVHLQEHLRQEQPQEHKLCIVWGRREQHSPQLHC